MGPVSQSNSGNKEQGKSEKQRRKQIGFVCWLVA